MTIQRNIAESTQRKSLRAIDELLSVVREFDFSTPEEEKLQKALGIIVGRIQFDVLDLVVSHHPDLDDLKKREE